MKVTSHQEGGETSMRVMDKGPGVSQKEWSKVFLPFTRLSQSLTEGVSGTGIGLTIARDLAVLHGGDIIIENSEFGACFLITLRTPHNGG